MSGHNKWSKIKRQKGAADAKRSKAFSRILKEVTVAVKESGPDPDGNPRLRLLMQNAKGVNMPKDTLMRAISKASDKDSAALQELTFECYAPHGIAIFIECLTDNNMRSVANVRSIMNKFGGTLGTNGSLGFIFDRKGVFVLPKKADMDLEMLEMELIDAGLEEMEVMFAIYPNPAKDVININTNAVKYEYQLINGLGQVVISGTSNGAQQINVSDINKGMYFLKVIADGEARINKIVVE